MEVGGGCMITGIRRVATGAVLVVKVALTQDDLIEVVTTMLLLLSIVVELLKMWLDSQKEEKVVE
jgi:hypothetical protein